MIYNMNLQEQISRIQLMMGVINEQTTGDINTIIKNIINKPVTLMGVEPIKTEVHKVDILNDGSLDIHFKNGQNMNISQQRFRSINLKIPLKFHLK